ncbi:hypothetical protein SSX86_030141 [Deinandra increscens subsp. villosa]|uniref:Isopenicillin N synthase-like Fe(2+) 2OG dioxygenase domain-containing protein n=1 Tax=Deinandra increscens subsp. villosa TaxID=3103831 RepID=A0AAP0CG64_9ASTR
MAPTRDRRPTTSSLLRSKRPATDDGSDQRPAFGGGGASDGSIGRMVASPEKRERLASKLGRRKNGGGPVLQVGGGRWWGSQGRWQIYGGGECRRFVVVVNAGEGMRVTVNTGKIEGGSGISHGTKSEICSWVTVFLMSVSALQVYTGKEGKWMDTASCNDIYQNEIGGLQVRSKEGKWTDIAPCTETLIVNIGDLMQAWSNGNLRSSEHSVVLKDKENTFRFFLLVFRGCKVVFAPDEVLGERGWRGYRPLCADYMKFRENKKGKLKKVGFTVIDFVGKLGKGGKENVGKKGVAKATKDTIQEVVGEKKWLGIYKSWKNGSCKTNLLSYLEDGRDVKEYDWCGYILSKIKVCKEGWIRDNKDCPFVGPLTILTLIYVDSTECDEFNYERRGNALEFWTTSKLKEREEMELRNG